MSRILLLTLVLVFAVLVTPSLRQRVEPHVQFALNPVYTWSARNELGEIQRFISRSRVLPAPQQFQAYLERERGRGGSVDPWGTPYYLLLERGTYVVGSAGRDRTPGTETDILSDPAPIPSPF